MRPIFILLAVGSLIGTWNMAGTIPTVVDYGIRLLNPSVFFLATAAICAVVGVVTGSSWTTAGTLGVAFVAMAKVMGLSDEIAAGAVICGAYFGDKMTPLSETTILVPKLVGGGLTVSRHVRNMFWTAGPALFGHPRRFPLRRGPGVLHSVGAGQGVRRRSGAGTCQHRHQSDLWLDGHGVREQQRRPRDRPALLARWDGEPADDCLARAR